MDKSKENNKISNNKKAQKSRIDIATPKNNQKKPKDQKLEIGGRDGLEPTRYGDWEKQGLCVDF